MKFIMVNDISDIKKKRNNDLHIYLEEFLSTNVKFVKVDISNEGYKNIASAYNTIKNSAKCHGLRIKVFMLNGEIYMENLEIS